VIFGAAGEPQFSDGCVLDPRVIALRDHVTAVPDAKLRKLEAHVCIRLKDGSTYSRHVEHALGSLQRPMSDADLETKFRGLTAGIISNRQNDELIRLCWSIAELPDAGAIVRAAQAGKRD
jgi:2-methylcitrate dehydratase PrpD